MILGYNDVASHRLGKKVFFLLFFNLSASVPTRRGGLTERDDEMHTLIESKMRSLS